MRGSHWGASGTERDRSAARRKVPKGESWQGWRAATPDGAAEKRASSTSRLMPCSPAVAGDDPRGKARPSPSAAKPAFGPRWGLVPARFRATGEAPGHKHPFLAGRTPGMSLAPQSEHRLPTPCRQGRWKRDEGTPPFAFAPSFFASRERCLNFQCARTAWIGQMRRYFFESDAVRDDLSRRNLARSEKSDCLGQLTVQRVRT